MPTNVSARELMLRSISEADWQDKVLQYAALNGYVSFHDQDSRRNNPGLPDLFLRRPADNDLVIAELKKEGGKVTPEQGAWLAAFQTHGVDTYCWRPSDWDEVEERLARRAA